MEFPLYMSPEERRREPVTPSSNVFSLGAILHHCVWGTPLQTAEGLREQPRAETESRLSTRTREVLDRMVAPSPQERFADCAELVDTLEGVGKGKPDFASVALCAGVVLAAVSSLIFFLKAASGLSPSSAGASISAASAAYPAASAESSRAETEFLASELFYFQHPERSGQAASRYQQIEDRFPGTVWAFNARKRIQEIGEQQREEQAREWERLTRDVARHRKDGHFAEAMGRIEDAGRSLWAAPLKSRLHALEEDILQAERSEYQETRGRAAALAAKGNLDQAARELDFVFRYYASKGIRESARRDSCTLREERRLPETQAPSP
jgi:hypothetical protein